MTCLNLIAQLTATHSLVKQRVFALKYVYGHSYNS